MITNRKIAIVHDSLLEFSGAERVLQSLLKIIPYADVYTLAAKKNAFETYFPELKRGKLRVLLPMNFNYSGSFLQLIAPFIWKRLQLEEYDLVIASTSYLMSNSVAVNKPIFIQYILCPPKNLFGIVPKNRLQRLIDYSRFINPIYHKAIHKTPFLLCDSKYIKNQLKDLFQVTVKVIYPPVEVPKKVPLNTKKSFFLSVSRISRTKNLELIISAFNYLKYPLKVVGDGVDDRYKKELKDLANKNIEFLGHIDDKKLAVLYGKAKALICASENEDFGISAVEAQGYGTQVIAFNGGEFKETVIPGKTGVLFNELSVESLVMAVKKFSKMRFKPDDCWKNARRFNSERFDREMRSYILEVLSKTWIKKK